MNRRSWYEAVEKVWNMIEKFNLQGWVVKDSTVILLPVAEYERLLASVKNKNYIRGLVR